MKKVIFLNGSPRGSKGVTHYYIEEMAKLLGDKVELEELHIFQGMKVDSTREVYEALKQAEAIVVSCSLYIDTLHAGCIKFLEGFEDYIKEEPFDKSIPPRMYGLCNNGFIEGAQNKYALKSIQHFAKRAGFNWQFGIGLGAGGFVESTKDEMPMTFIVKQPIYNALKTLSEAILEETDTHREDLLVQPAMPAWLFRIMANQFWKKGAKENKVLVKDLKKATYNLSK